MKLGIKAAILSVSVFWAFAAAPSIFAAGADESAIREAITRLDNADPGKDVDEALRKGDRRFVGIRGLSTYVPGVDKFDEHYKVTYGVRIILMARDFVRSPQLERLNEAAVRYAASYNRLLLARIRSK
jgi:hypothetical protein